MNRSEYQADLASREWASLKRKVRERSGGRCERCLVGNYDATHHLTYERVGDERLEDLQAICDACHKFLSGESDSDPRIAVDEHWGEANALLQSVDGDVSSLIEHLLALRNPKTVARLSGILEELNRMDCELEARFLDLSYQLYQEKNQNKLD
jgi:hypothetical protein